MRWRWILPVVVGLVAAAPLAWTPYFASDDGLVHLWRIWEYARTAAEVGPLVRWVPDIAYGYGAPCSASTTRSRTRSARYSCPPARPPRLPRAPSSRCRWC